VTAESKPGFRETQAALRWIRKAEKRFLNLDDFEPAARRILPPMLYMFVSGGVETNAALSANAASFQDYGFVPRILRNVAGRSQKVRLFDKEYDHPFGIAPMGDCAACAYRADLLLAAAATARNIPLIVSASSLISLEEIRQAAPGAWFQAYLSSDPAHIEAMADRVAAAGYDTFVLTVDIPVPPNREHYVRTGFSIPLRPSFNLVLQGITHPRWLIGTALRTLIRHGMPRFENLNAERGLPFLSSAAVRSMALRDSFDWESLKLLRRRWKGRLVVKGILSPEDANEAERSGVDAIIVSNHGGRQLDDAVAPLHMLPQIRERVRNIPVMLDSGIRRGTDVLKALGLGASFVFIGRPFLYATVVGGAAGVCHAIDLMMREIDRDMAMIGIREISAMSREYLIAKGGPASVGPSAVDKG
jgi:L-lactate dehydrogenase (cytochrome)